MSPSGKGRGPGPKDKKLFGADQLPALSQGVEELSFLFGRGYAEASALKLVGDRHQLQKRQRLALLRCSVGQPEITYRETTRVEDLDGTELDIDGFNLLIMIEAALGGALILQGMDGSFRDLSSVHGTYKTVSHTLDSLALIGEELEARGVALARWWFDSPVSNSARVMVHARTLAAERGWPWEVALTPHVDRVVTETEGIAVSSDKVILRRCARWTPLGNDIIEKRIPDAWIVRLPAPALVGEAQDAQI